MSTKPKVMIKYADGYMMTKRQQDSYEDGLLWVFAQSPAKEGAEEAVGQIFAAHGYEVVEWDDDVEVVNPEVQIDLNEGQ
jgi:hypothetical protein